MKCLRYELPSGGEIYIGHVRTMDPGLGREFAERIGEIGAHAWAESEWMRDVILGNGPATLLHEYDATARELGSNMFERSAFTNVRTNHIVTGGPKIWGAFQGAAIAPERMIGFATTTSDVSGSIPMEIVKRGIDLVAPAIPMQGSPVYTKIEGINVLPEAQSQGIGLSMLHTALLYSRFWRKATAYSSTVNEAAERFFTENGFHATGIKEDVTRYFGKEFPIDQVRYESDYDREGTISKLQMRHRWLGRYTKLFY